jgi:hypothetical protein
VAADTVADWPQVARAGDGALRALWALLAGQLLRSGKESWLRTCTGSRRAPPIGGMRSAVPSLVDSPADVDADLIALRTLARSCTAR